MRTIPLSENCFTKVSDKDFKRVLAAGPWHRSTVTRAHKGVLYAARNSERDGKRTTETMHRFILGIKDPAVQADHRDTDGLNNQRYNLRIATAVQNSQSRRKRANCISEYKGVSWHVCRSKWRARIQVEGIRKSLGLFSSEKEAAKTYDKAALMYFGAFARLNFTKRG
jgi:hypothetical protein